MVHDKMILTTVISGLAGGKWQIGERYTVVARQQCTTAKVMTIQYKPHIAVSHEDSNAFLQNELVLLELEVSLQEVPALMPNNHAGQICLFKKNCEELLAEGMVLCKRPIESDGFTTCPAIANGLTVWLTGLSGAGKTTLAQELAGMPLPYSRVEVLDGDVVRTHICKGLGFTKAARIENVRRLAFLAKLLTDDGALVLVSAISPYRAGRDEARASIGRFLEVYVNAPLWLCESRDPKGLYKKARAGELGLFTAIDDPYEPPLAAEVECCTALEPLDQSLNKIMKVIHAHRHSHH